MEPVPPFRGMHKLADSQRESTGNSRTFDILRPVAVVHLQTAQYDRREEPTTLIPSFTPVETAREGLQCRRRTRRQCYRHRHRLGQKLRRTGEEWLIGRVSRPLRFS